MGKSRSYIDKNGNHVTLEELLRGRSREQEQVIRYFFNVSKGCFSSVMKDSEYMAIVKKARDSMDFRKRALDKIGIDEDQVNEINPVMFEGFSYSKAYAKHSSSGWLSSKYEITWLFFSSEQVYLYSYAFSFDDGSKKEITNEYFYKDITSFTTIYDSEEAYTASGKKSVESNIFKMVVPGDTFTCSMEGNDDTETIIRGMKQKLREKKL